jgi:phospholipid transport system substrate-binding protein
MIRILFTPFIFMMAYVFLGHAAMAAQTKEQPDVMLQRVTQEMIAALRQHDRELREDPDRIFPIIDKLLVPHIDWLSMSRWVIGRNAWMSASTFQQERFSHEFKDLLIRTYASTLRAYNNQTIEYLPIRGGSEGKSRVQVASFIREQGKEPIKVAYRLVDQGSSWKVYDISIEGISLLKGFQSQFSTEIQQNGIEKLTERLHEHNEKPLR